MNAKSIIIAAGLVALSITDARADLKLTVKSKQPSRVYLNGSRQGRAPVSFRGLRSGVHWVDVQNMRNGAFRRVKVVSPRRFRSAKVVKVDFRRPKGVQVINLPAPTVRPRKLYRDGRNGYGKKSYPAPVIHRPVYHPPLRPNPPVVKAQDRSYVRKRNTILALGAAKELFNRGRDKKDMRGALVGATVLNEILNK